MARNGVGTGNPPRYGIELLHPFRGTNEDIVRGTTHLASDPDWGRCHFIYLREPVLPRQRANLPACSEGDGLINAHFSQGLAPKV